MTGSISDKEIVKQSGLVNLLEEGDAVMADKGFLIFRDILAFKKVKLVSPAYCRGPRLTAKGTTHTRRVASLRTHVERNILKLKQFRILSGVILGFHVTSRAFPNLVVGHVGVPSDREICDNSMSDLATLSFSSKFCGRKWNYRTEKAIRTQIGPVRVSLSSIV